MLWVWWVGTAARGAAFIGGRSVAGGGIDPRDGVCAPLDLRGAGGGDWSGGGDPWEDALGQSERRDLDHAAHFAVISSKKQKGVLF